MCRFFNQFLAVVLFSTGMASAEQMSAPQGDPVLTIIGDIQSTNIEDTAVFDMAMLAAMPAKSFATTTIWTEGKNSFVGVPLSALLKMVGADGGTLRATAINDYSVEIPIDAIDGDVPVIAYEMDGKPMSVRQKGPLWIVYPYDSDADYRSELVYSRSIWQLDRLEVID